MQLNNITYNDRHNRPSVIEKVGLQAFFLIDGQYTDPYQISAVTIFPRATNLYPSSILDSTTQLIDSASVSGSVLMNFCNSSTLTTNTAFDTSNYTGGQTASGIYRTGTGKYIVILDGTINLTGKYNLDGANTTVTNGADYTGDYIDVWTVNMSQGSELQVVINEFTLRKGGFTVVTEPLMIKAKNRLVNNRVTLGSKVDLKVATTIYVENTNVDESIKNLLRDNVITEASIEIQKINEAANLPSRITVSSFTNTADLVDITADNVIRMTWDTSELQTHPQLYAGNFDSIRGVYAIRTKYNIFNEIIISDPMYLTLS